MATDAMHREPPPASTALAAGEVPHGRLRMLDGWRAASILFVLAGHMLPLGPADWEMNASIAANGMAIFFTLSGFLIVSILHRNADVGTFIVRRLARILPLAWLALIVSLPLQGASSSLWCANLLFYANLPPFRLLPWTSHYWSLGVEMQFYVAIAFVVLAFERRGLAFVPAAAVAVTAIRIATGTNISIVTWLRVDEILSGGILALALSCRWQGRATAVLRRLPFWPIVLLFFLSTRPELPWLNYIRPYLTSTMVGITVVRPVPGLSRLLQGRVAAYLAQVSYAVYIIHHFTVFGWLNSGHGIAKYAKRPISFGITFALAHLSTFHFESRFIDWGHRVVQRRRPRVPIPLAR